VVEAAFLVDYDWGDNTIYVVITNI